MFSGSPSCVYMHNLETLHDKQQAFFATVTRYGGPFNDNRTEWSPILSVTLQVVKEIFLIVTTITDRIGFMTQSPLTN